MTDPIQVLFNATPAVEVGFDAMVPGEVEFFEEGTITVEFEVVDDQ